MQTGSCPQSRSRCCSCSLVHAIVVGRGLTPTDLLIGGSGIWMSNVLVFALIYWGFDRVQ